MEEKREEITYTIGRLSKKLGMSSTPLRRHLESSGLIAECYRDVRGWLRIPYSTALRLTGGDENALAIQKPNRGKGRKRVDPEIEELFEKPSQAKGKKQRKAPRAMPTSDRFAYYQEVGKMLARAGVTAKDILTMYEREITSES